MSGYVVCGDGGTGQDELPGLFTLIHSATNVVPDSRLDLPFVDETRSISVEDQGRVDRDGVPGILVDVEPLAPPPLSLKPHPDFLPSRHGEPLLGGVIAGP